MILGAVQHARRQNGSTDNVVCDRDVNKFYDRDPKHVITEIDSLTAFLREGGGCAGNLDLPHQRATTEVSMPRLLGQSRGAIACSGASHVDRWSSHVQRTTREKMTSAFLIIPRSPSRILHPERYPSQTYTAVLGVYHLPISVGSGSGRAP